MVIRRVAGGHAAAPGPRSLLPFAFVLSLGLAASATAQAPAQSPPPGEPGGAVPEAAAQAPEAVYGRIVADTAHLRCWPGAVAAPPMFEDTLAKGQVVTLGRSENGFRAVLLPLGPLGYVSQRFAQANPDGSVVSKGRGVAFRYRPRTTEAPVAQLADGTPLAVLGTQDDWYHVRVAGIEAWLPAAEIEVIDTPMPGDLAAVEQLRVATQAEVQARLNGIAAEQARIEQGRIDLAAVKVVEDAFQAELSKPMKEQQLEPLGEALGKVMATLAENSSARPVGAALASKIEAQRFIVEAMVLNEEQPPVSTEPAAAPPVKDPLRHFDAIGWLRVENRFGSLRPTYYLEKGGRRQHELTCNTGRFNLSLFVGREVGISGPRRTPLEGRLGTLDVERLVVLGSASR